MKGSEDERQELPLFAVILGAYLLISLNRFVSDHNASSAPDQRYEQFTSNDLSKLAFWMATGSGKTLLLHFNYLQFMHYNRKPLDNILLITPNEGLSQQHLDELQVSNIPAMRFDLDQASGLMSQSGAIKVTEITKLVEDKKGGGVWVPVETFEGNNQIFVDEAHKGAGGEAWRGMRDALAETGFTFEYSATFGQALAAANNDALLTEYGKAIAFDYSYRHFYSDGYGKDFRILNLQQESAEEQTDTLLMANLISFYEQQLVFAEQETALRPYNLSRPLWMFIGRNVNAVYRESGKSRSDILTVARFLHRVLRDRDWAIGTIARLLTGDSGLKYYEGGPDIVADKFEYLRRRETDAEAVYLDAIAKVMHTDGGGLELCSLAGSPGELGLKAAGSPNYFGVINIGDALALLVKPPDSYYEEPDGLRVAWLESAAERIPQETLLRIPQGGIPLDALTGALEGTGFEAAAQAGAWVFAETGNFFLDHTYEDGNYDGFADPWEDDIIREGTEEWRKASALMDSVMQLADWLEEDLPGRFAEMLDFILGRLPNQETSGSVGGMAQTSRSHPATGGAVPTQYAETGTCFGLVEGFESELGYFDLTELAEATVFGSVPAVERDLYWEPTTLGEIRRQSRS